MPHIRLPPFRGGLLTSLKGFAPFLPADLLDMNARQSQQACDRVRQLMKGEEGGQQAGAEASLAEASLASLAEASK